MKFGVKTFDSEKFLDFFKDKCDFFEVQAIRGNDYSFLEKYDLPIVLHCEHQGFGVNLADSSKRDFNLEAINFAKSLADKIGVKKIVIHPGEMDNENCSIENSINFLKDFCDERFCIENLPSKDDISPKKKLCSTPEEMKYFLDETKLDFCFDINHALETASNNNLDFVKILTGFEKLKPMHYHIGGQNTDKGIYHLNFSESDLNIAMIFEIVSPFAEFTLETSIAKEGVLNDLKILDRI